MSESSALFDLRVLGCIPPLLEDTTVTCYTADNLAFASCIRKKMTQRWRDDSCNVLVSTAGAKDGSSPAPSHAVATFLLGQLQHLHWPLNPKP